MEERFSVCPHDVLPGKQMVEFWREGQFVAGIYPHQDGIRVVSKYMTGVSEEAGLPPAAIIFLGKEPVGVAQPTYTITVNAFESGVLMGLLMQAEDRTRAALDDVWKQLVVLKKAAEEEAGVTKEILPGGMIRIKDKDGTVIIRQPYPYEVEDN